MRAAPSARRVVLLFLTFILGAALFSGPAAAQDISINLGGGNGGVTERAIQLIALLTILSLAPSIVVMMTSFTRIVVVLSLLRTALGTATAPPNTVIVALALFLTAFVMGPTLQRSYDERLKPLVANQITGRAGARARRRPLARLHAEERAREGLEAVHGPVGRSAAGHARRDVDAHPGAGLHDLAN